MESMKKAGGSAAPAGKGDVSWGGHNESITSSSPTVNPSEVEQFKNDIEGVNLLARIRILNGVKAEEMVGTVKAVYPQYSERLHDQCEHGSRYGVQLRDDAMNAILMQYAPALMHRRQHDKVRNANRIQVRLSEPAAAALKEALDKDGLTVQAWMEGQVFQYLKERKAALEKA